MNDVKTELADGTATEILVIYQILTILKPYIPAKENRCMIMIANVLPFCLLANDILDATGYSKLTRLLFPQPKPTCKQALGINAPSLYQMLKAEPDSRKIADFDSNLINSVEYARSNKDAVFGSVFEKHRPPRAEH